MDKWENDELCLELNHGNCAMDGRHPKTSDDDWALFQRAIAEDYSEKMWHVLHARLVEREYEAIVKTLTADELWEEMQNVDYERKEFVRGLSGQTWSDEDTETYERMNRWAAAVYAELVNRNG